MTPGREDRPAAAEAQQASAEEQAATLERELRRMAVLHRLAMRRRRPRTF